MINPNELNVQYNGIEVSFFEHQLIIESLKATRGKYLNSPYLEQPVKKKYLDNFDRLLAIMERQSTVRKVKDEN